MRSGMHGRMHRRMHGRMRVRSTCAEAYRSDGAHREVPAEIPRRKIVSRFFLVSSGSSPFLPRLFPSKARRASRGDAQDFDAPSSPNSGQPAFRLTEPRRTAETLRQRSPWPGVTRRFLGFHFLGFHFLRASVPQGFGSSGFGSSGIAGVVGCASGRSAPMTSSFAPPPRASTNALIPSGLSTAVCHT